MTDTVSIDADAELKGLRAQLEALKAENAALLTRAKAAEALADHDALTPVLNRRGFVAVLERTMAYCRRYEATAVLLYLDLDGFKAVNDSLGHAAGDAALIHVASLLLANSRAADAVGRLGGDEFALLMVNAGVEEGRDKARKLADIMQTDGFEWQGRQRELGGSFGVRIWAQQADPELWLAEADAAMWVRKRAR